ncbi:hypothetical protein GCM10009754_30730 [Amycolatopsis minnesotensis]|uniref:Uncharacterized protein n=1 Tax=Amycolatopsis minnesotensis TaxID=337894 RepID=A0ABP5C695_9PSEU
MASETDRRQSPLLSITTETSLPQTSVAFALMASIVHAQQLCVHKYLTLITFTRWAPLPACAYRDALEAPNAEERE